MTVPSRAAALPRAFERAAIAFVASIVLHAAALLAVVHWAGKGAAPAPAPTWLEVELSPVLPGERPAAATAQRTQTAPHRAPRAAAASPVAVRRDVVPRVEAITPDAQWAAIGPGLEELAAAAPPQEPAEPVAPAIESAAAPATATMIEPAGGDPVALVRAWLARYQHYPRAARRGRIEGVVKLDFVLDGHGQVLRSALAGSSGSVLLDRAAMELLERATPFPVEFGVGERGFEIEVEYRLLAGGAP
jgi:protein TonB